MSAIIDFYFKYFYITLKKKMNLYIRYFDDEAVVSSIDDAVKFLNSLNIPDFKTDDDFIADLEEFIASPVTYPKRYKVRTHSYFIVIKTSVSTLEEFKANAAKNLMKDVTEAESNRKKPKGAVLNDQIPGWYDGELCFKRVIAIPGTNKFQYKDTSFRALVKAGSPMDCYNRIVDHLKNRPEVDPRSQYPSPKGRNFTFTYMGNVKPKMEELEQR